MRALNKLDACATRYLKSHYSDQLLISTALCILWVSSPEKVLVMLCRFSVFCELFNFDFKFSIRHDISKALTCINI